MLFPDPRRSSGRSRTVQRSTSSQRWRIALHPEPPGDRHGGRGIYDGTPRNQHQDRSTVRWRLNIIYYNKYNFIHHTNTIH